MPLTRTVAHCEQQGKKKVKAISKALRNLNRTPTGPAPAVLAAEDASDRIPFTHYDFGRSRPPTARSLHSLPEIEEVAPEDEVENPSRPPQASGRRQSHTLFAQSPPIIIPGRKDGSQESTPERSPLNRARDIPPTRRQMNYGSIIGTPPDDEPLGHMAALELPDPALSPSQSRGGPEVGPSVDAPAVLPEPALPATAASAPQGSDAYHVGESTSRPHGVRHNLRRSIFKKRQGVSSSSTLPPKANTVPRSRLRKMFTSHVLDEPVISDIQLEAYKELDLKQAEFYTFLDRELDKIETFYRIKEEEASDRLQTLRRQLHEMRDRRMVEIIQTRNDQHTAGHPHAHGSASANAENGPPLKEHGPIHENGSRLVPKPIGEALHIRTSIGKTSQAMEQLSSPMGPRARRRVDDAKDDYVRHNHGRDVPHRFAKRRLKLALQEFYRGMELLKSYALLNRTGFRKINKKYDKAVQARPPLRYMAEKVNHAYFVTSDVIDNHLVAVEDLYSRYFERGNHKVAVRKLRSKLGAGDQSGTTFRNGLYVAAGTCFAVAGLVDGADRLFDANTTVSTQTSYLLQLYAGYFLALLLFLLFCLDCRVWTKCHINYTFIFEYDTRHVLDWRQLSELPCFFLFLNGLFLYLNFRQATDDWFFLYWPVLLIALTLIILAFPFKILYHNARKWWAYSNFRLLLAGLYPVEFRDFFLGDMYCSQTYAMSQIEVFFCLYGTDWRNPAQCNSNHSRLLGFFATVPAIWRAFQCLRRYYDSRNWFPHLANFAKYCCNILYYATLSVYRININSETRAVFITFAALNGVYCSFWDVFMDFSLGNPWSKHPFLRDQLAYKRKWVYYVAIVADVVLRQQWIFYAIFTSDLQHSAVMSFFVSLAEVLRRGMWSLFRVENEHCNNVGKFRASRDIPLPYELSVGSPETTMVPTPSPVQSRQPTSDPSERPDHPELHLATGADLERATSASSSVRQRRTPLTLTPRTPGMRALQRVGTVLAAAHAQDFEKRRRPEIGTPGAEDLTTHGAGHSSDEDDDDDDDDLMDDTDGPGSGTQRYRQERSQRRLDSQEIQEAEILVSRARGDDY